MWDLWLQHVRSSTLTRDWTQAPCIWECRVVATGPPRKSLSLVLMAFSKGFHFHSNKTHSEWWGETYVQIHSNWVISHGPAVEVSKRAKLLSCVQLFVTPWTIAHQAPLSMEFSRPEYWSGLPFPSPGDPADPEIEPGSPVLQADSLLSEKTDFDIKTLSMQYVLL